MPMTISIPLFWKPEDELPSTCGDEVTEAQLRALAEQLHARLLRAAAIVGRLRGAGWQNSLCLYDVECWTHWATPAQAEQELRKLGIDPADVHLDQLDDDGDYVDNEEEDDEAVRDMTAPGRQQHAI
jgi:hypothetical protein